MKRFIILLSAFMVLFGGTVFAMPSIPTGEEMVMFPIYSDRVEDWKIDSTWSQDSSNSSPYVWVTSPSGDMKLISYACSTCDWAGNPAEIVSVIPSGTSLNDKSRFKVTVRNVTTGVTAFVDDLWAGMDWTWLYGYYIVSAPPYANYTSEPAKGNWDGIRSWVGKGLSTYHTAYGTGNIQDAYFYALQRDDGSSTYLKLFASYTPMTWSDDGTSFVISAGGSTFLYVAETGSYNTRTSYSGIYPSQYTFVDVTTEIRGHLANLYDYTPPSDPNKYIQVTPLGDWTGPQDFIITSKGYIKYKLSMNGYDFGDKVSIYDFSIETETRIPADDFWQYVGTGTNTLTITTYDLYDESIIGDILSYEFNYVGDPLNNPPPDFTGDPDSLEKPTPPENPANLFGWLRYFGDWIAYIFDGISSVLARIVVALGEVFDSFKKFSVLLSQFFSFLPSPIVSIILIGIGLSVIVGLLRR